MLCRGVLRGVEWDGPSEGFQTPAPFSILLPSKRQFLRIAHEDCVLVGFTHGEKTGRFSFRTQNLLRSNS